MARVSKSIFVGLAVFLLSSSFAFAHERQVVTVDGEDYLFVVGSLNEPIVVGDKTGIDLRIVTPDQKDIGNASATNSKPVLGLEKTLRVENISGNARKEFPLSVAWGKPGSYQTVFYPSRSGDFSYRIFGTINGKDVDLRFDCNEAGHVMSEMNGDNMHMKNGNFDVKFHAGSFGCAKEKAEFMFPSVEWKDVVKNNIFGIISLLLVIVFIGYTIKTKK